jgi:hypothetical protein
MSEPASSEERRRRLDLLVDEASMLSFPASDPPAVFVEEPEPSSDESRTRASPTRSTEVDDTVRDKRALRKTV